MLKSSGMVGRNAININNLKRLNKDNNFKNNKMRRTSNTLSHSLQNFGSTNNNRQQSDGNLFSWLGEVNTDDEDQMETEQVNLSNQTNSAKVAKIHLPPPITIIGNNIQNIHDIIDKLKLERKQFTYRLSFEGVKVYASTQDLHKSLCDGLIKAQIQFYSHRLRENQLSKFVLHGLNEMSETDLRVALKEADARIDPYAIKELTLKNKKYDDHHIYLLYFLKTSKVKLSDLKDIKTVNYLRVRWEYYSNPKKGPTQCSRCQSFGHGSENCFLNPRCVRCGLNHFSKDCTFIEVNPITNEKCKKIPDKHVRCALCNGPHTANYSECEKRKEFIMNRRFTNASRTLNNKQHSQFSNIPTRNLFKEAPELNNFNFPALRNNNKQQNSNPVWVETQMTNSNQNSLLSKTELLSIFMTMMNKMSNAKTRQDQLRILMEVVLHHCYPDGN